MILWGSFCGVHTVFDPEHVAYWRERGYRVLVHPECPKPVVDVADGAGSTSYLWKAMSDAKPGEQARDRDRGPLRAQRARAGALRGVEVVNMADIPRRPSSARWAAAARPCRATTRRTWSRSSTCSAGPPAGPEPRAAGDVVNEITGVRERLTADERATLVRDARARSSA